jgi:ligand-binding sensor domain-containing protein
MMSLRLVAITILTLLTSLVFASAADARPSSQDSDLNDPGNWWTYAGGDEIIALEVHPEDGRVLAGTDGGGLIVWNDDLDDFRQVIFPNQRGFQASTVYDIAVDPVSGDLWLATDYGVAHAQEVPGAAPSAWVWTTYINTYAGVEDFVDGVEQVDEDGMPETRVFSAIAVGADGRVYAGTPSSGVAIRDVDGFWTKVESDLFVSDPNEPVEGPAHLSIADIAVRIDALEPEDNEVWFVHGRADSDAAVSRYLPATGEWFHTPSQGRGGDPELGPTDHQVVSLSVDPSTGVVWLGMWNQGVFRYDPVEDVWSQTQRNRDGLCTSGASVGIWAIDAVDGQAWAACGPVSKGVGRGVAHFDGSGWTTYSGGVAMPDDVISALVIGIDGQVFLGHENFDESGPIGGYGIVEYTAGGTPRRLSTAGGLPQFNELTTLLFDSRGRLWAGTRGGGLLLRQDGKWRRFTRAGTGSALLGDTITDLLQRGDELWIGSAERIYVSSENRYLDGGISRYDLSNDTWGEPIVPVEDPSPGAPEGLPDGQISALADAGGGGVWIGFGETSARAIPPIPRTTTGFGGIPNWWRAWAGAPSSTWLPWARSSGPPCPMPPMARVSGPTVGPRA